MVPPKKTPVQLSGGAGFDFEDAIAARFLFSMLRGEAVFGVEQGTSMQLDFQSLIRNTIQLKALYSTASGSIDPLVPVLLVLTRI